MPFETETARIRVTIQRCIKDTASTGGALDAHRLAHSVGSVRGRRSISEIEELILQEAIETGVPVKFGHDT